MCFRCRLIFVTCAFVTQVYGRHTLEGCRLDLVNTSKDKFPPLLFHNYTTYFELVVPEKGKINLNRGDKITLACSGKRNYLTATNSNSTYATCLSESTLRIFRNNLNFDDLQCKKDTRSEIRKTRQTCANGEGYIKEIGYQITRSDWFTLFKICYDDVTGVTFYTEHDLHGNEIKYSIKTTDRPGFSTDGLGPGIAASVAYTQTFQKSTFNRLLDSAHLASYYINNRSYLARGHLSPSADFLLATSKRATFYLINATPQWQVINGGNWKSVETSIRKTAETYNRTFTILTGTYGILSLPDINENLTPIYLLSGYKLPVPQAIWKIMYNQETQMGIAIVVMNNPFLEKISQEDLLCDNICDQYGWSTANWGDSSRGFTYCCDLKKFMKVVHTVPRLKVRGVLYGTASL